MASDLKELMAQVGDRGAPKGFVQQLRRELVREAALHGGTSGDGSHEDVLSASHLVPVVELTPLGAHGRLVGARTAGRWIAVAACTALFVVFGVAALTQSEATGTLETLAPNEDVVAPVGSIANGVSSELSPGSYIAQALDVEIRFATPESLSVVRSDGAALQLSAPFIDPAHEQTITFVRLTRLAEVPNPLAGTEVAAALSLAPLVESRISELAEQQVARNVEAASIGGRAATRFDVAHANPFEDVRVWIIDGDEPDPIVIVVSSTEECASGWLEGCRNDWLAKAQRLLWSIELD